MLCIAHRGASGYELENTLPAFERALELFRGLAEPAEQGYPIDRALLELLALRPKLLEALVAEGGSGPAEIDALPVIRLLIERVLGQPAAEGEKVYYSVPAEPIDRDMNVTYHQGIFDGLVPASTGIGGGPVSDAHDLCLGIYAVKAGLGGTLTDDDLAWVSRDTVKQVSADVPTHAAALLVFDGH